MEMPSFALKLRLATRKYTYKAIHIFWVKTALLEEPNLPKLFVNVCDPLGFQVVGIGDKMILDTDFRIDVCGQKAERRFNAFEPDVLAIGGASGNDGRSRDTPSLAHKASQSR